ncbi:sporulation-delaying protein SdpB family protein [Ascidiimonas sp. W6]|uniref:sporulation-delaying protein SdpB family protein n=1 Tax=Ascidiimonas meishanensis TaxID=3128903 RepID=UPI0030EEE1EC
MKIAFSYTNLLGLGRSLLALGTLLTLLVNSNSVLFDINILSQQGTVLQNTGIFYLMSNHLLGAKLICILILILVMSGWYPKITGILHWYVSYSFFTSCNIVDGGDHITAVLTFLLIPITLTDPRKNHWYGVHKTTDNLKATLARAFFILIQIQVCAIYFHAFVGKIGVDAWLNGTATYYWLTHEFFGIHEVLNPLFNTLLANPFVVTLVTWGTLVLEFLLAACILLDKHSKRRYLMLLAGLLFHFSILAVHGLFTFFFAITACLILYLVPEDTVLTREMLANWKIKLKSIGRTAHI